MTMLLDLSLTQITMCTATNFVFPPKHSKWDYSLEIKCNYDVTAVSLLVIDENRDVKFYHKVENVPYEEARLIAINFCKHYGINRDRELVRSFKVYEITLHDLGEGYMMIG